MWNYAKNFAMSDNFFGTTFGPSAPGAINLVSGDTGNVGLQINGADTDGDTVSDGQGGYSLIEDAQPYYDDCSTRDAVSLTGTNIGDELNAKGLSWGWFQGGFRPTTTLRRRRPAWHVSRRARSLPTSSRASSPAAAARPTRDCATRCTRSAPRSAVPAAPPGPQLRQQGRLHRAPRAVPVLRVDGQPAPPGAGVAGGDRHRHADLCQGGVPQFDTANHQYDMSDFNSLVGAIRHGYLSPDHLPAVSFLKAPGYQDGHAGYSDPYDEQQFVTTEINALRADAGLVEHRGDRHLRRLRRVLRPRLQRRPQPVEHERQSPTRPGRRTSSPAPGCAGRARRSPGRTDAAATARGCRSCSSRRGRSVVRSITR